MMRFVVSLLGIPRAGAARPGTRGARRCPLESRDRGSDRDRLSKARCDHKDIHAHPELGLFRK